MSNPLQHTPAGEHPPGFHPSQHWDPLLKQGEGKALYSRFFRPGELVFDIGANVGQRTGWFIELGARVVAVEPYQSMSNYISREATVVEKAVGARVATDVPFYICDSSPYLSTLEERYVEQVHAQPGIAGNIYHQTSVDVTTLDALIDEHGLPVFVKIDVEGGELGVLLGLSQPLRALSFEAHAFDPDKTQLCIERLAGLGDYRYRYSRLETFVLEEFPPKEWAIFGDVYATLAT